MQSVHNNIGNESEPELCRNIQIWLSDLLLKVTQNETDQDCTVKHVSNIVQQILEYTILFLSNKRYLLDEVSIKLHDDSDYHAIKNLHEIITYSRHEETVNATTTCMFDSQNKLSESTFMPTDDSLKVCKSLSPRSKNYQESCFICLKSTKYDKAGLQLHIKDNHVVKANHGYELQCQLCPVKFRCANLEVKRSFSALITKCRNHLSKMHAEPRMNVECTSSNLGNENFDLVDSQISLPTHCVISEAIGTINNPESTDFNELPIPADHEDESIPEATLPNLDFVENEKDVVNSCLKSKANKDAAMYFDCPMCNAEMQNFTVRSWKQCRSHFKTKHLEQDEKHWWLSCKICQQQFKYTKSKLFVDIGFLVKYYMTHMVQKHNLPPPNGLKSYTCDSCDFITFTVREFGRHIMSYHKEPTERLKVSTSTECEKCGKKITPAYADPHHLYCAGRRDSDKKCVLCPVCQREYTSEKGLLYHLDTVHKGNKDFLCNICAKTFPRKYNLELHLLRMHGVNETGKETVKCHICGHVNFAGYNMIVHMQTHTSGHYPCKRCSASFQTLTKLRSHVKWSHGKHKTLHCPHCPYTSLVKRRIQQHVSVKHQNQVIKCPVCGYRTVTAEKLQYHMTKQHANNNEQNCPRKAVFMCQVCSASFSNNHRLQTHLFSKHKINQTKKTPLKCPYTGCTFECIDNFGMKRHNRMSHSKGHYPCHVCNKVFNCSVKVENHIQRKHPVKNSFRCELCSYVVDDKGHFNLHMLRKHAGPRMKCPSCKYYTFHERLFRRHVEKNHPGLNIEDYLQKLSEQRNLQAAPELQPPTEESGHMMHNIVHDDRMILGAEMRPQSTLHYPHLTNGPPPPHLVGGSLDLGKDDHYLGSMPMMPPHPDPMQMQSPFSTHMPPPPPFHPTHTPSLQMSATLLPPMSSSDSALMTQTSHTLGAPPYEPSLTPLYPQHTPFHLIHQPQNQNSLKLDNVLFNNPPNF